MAFLKPAIDAIGAADNLKFKGKNFKTFGDAYKAVYEAVNLCSWVTMAPPMGTPATHIEAQKDATNFNLIKIQRAKKDELNQNFVKSLQALNNAMTDYAKQYFKKDGLVYNPKVKHNNNNYYYHYHYHYHLHIYISYTQQIVYLCLYSVCNGFEALYST